MSNRAGEHGCLAVKGFRNCRISNSGRTALAVLERPRDPAFHYLGTQFGTMDRTTTMLFASQSTCHFQSAQQSAKTR
jgi:hypothetical protein